MIRPLSANQLQGVVTANIASNNVVKAKDIDRSEPPQASPAPLGDRAELSLPSEEPKAPQAEGAHESAGTAQAASPSPASRGEAKTGPDVMTTMESVSDDIVAGLPPESVVNTRSGELLGEGMILKLDQYPTLQNEKLAERIPGAPNFRQVKGTEVYGVAQPTVDGIRNVLDRAGAKERTVQWTNMREEPVVYVNGRSFSLRDLKKPYENSDEFQGLDGKEMDHAEQDLKAEILAEAEKFGGKMLVHGEGADGKVTSEWIPVTKDTVKTTDEVYAGLKEEGYKVDFERVPVTDEKTPEAADLEALVKRVGSADPSTPMIFNCHAGRGRTTTAMVAAQLIQEAKKGATDETQDDFHRLGTVHQDIREQGKYERGEYRLILRTIQALDNGTASKSQTDKVLDRTEDMQNLRTEIAKLRDKANDVSKDEGSRGKAEARGLDYLHRYHTLISFNEYVNENAKSDFKVSYSEWLATKPELGKMLETFELAFQANPAGNGSGTQNA